MGLIASTPESKTAGLATALEAGGAFLQRHLVEGNTESLGTAGKGGHLAVGVRSHIGLRDSSGLDGLLAGDLLAPRSEQEVAIEVLHEISPTTASQPGRRTYVKTILMCSSLSLRAFSRRAAWMVVN